MVAESGGHNLTNCLLAIDVVEVLDKGKVVDKVAVVVVGVAG